jgi:hypothetical protein
MTNDGNKGLFNWFTRDLKIGTFFLICGFILGLLGTIAYDNYKGNLDDKVTARLIYDELNDPTNAITIIAPYYLSDPNYQINPDYRNESNWILLGDSFYPKYSMFPLIKSNIGRFSPSLYENLSKYDRALSFAEKDRTMLVEISREVPNSTKSYYQTLLEPSETWVWNEMMYEVRYCNKQNAIIKKQLNDEYSLTKK